MAKSNYELIKESEEIFADLERIRLFEQKYRIPATAQEQEVQERIAQVLDNITPVAAPANKDELLREELRRKLTNQYALLDPSTHNKGYDFDTVVRLFNIPEEDLKELPDWLKANKAETEETRARVWKSTTDIETRIPLATDIPSTRVHAEAVASTHIRKYHQAIGRMLESQTNIGHFLRDVEAAPTFQDRSYFDPRRNRVAISISAICYDDKNGNISINEYELIRLFGHEGMGHALNHVLTMRNSALPKFLQDSSSTTIATEESIAQFYEAMIFDALKARPDVQRELDIYHKFDELMQHAKDVALFEEYQKKLSQFRITVLGDKSLGDPKDPKVMKRKAEIICEVSLSPQYERSYVEGHYHSFDSQGNLNWKLVSELRYCGQPVRRALDILDAAGLPYKDNRSTIDKLFLEGFWTPTGFVQNVELFVKNR